MFTTLMIDFKMLVSIIDNYFWDKDIYIMYREFFLEKYLGGYSLMKFENSKYNVNQSQHINLGIRILPGH